jgi:hypothetical protein
MSKTKTYRPRFDSVVLPNSAESTELCGHHEQHHSATSRNVVHKTFYIFRENNSDKRKRIGGAHRCQ